MKNWDISKNKKLVLKINLGKVYFEHDMTYRDFKELLRITASDRVLCDKAFNIAKNPIYDGYQCGLALMVYKLFDKKASDGAATWANN